MNFGKVRILLQGRKYRMNMANGAFAWEGRFGSNTVA